MSTTTGIPIGQLPVLGAVTDDSYVVGEHAGSGLFSALALKSYGAGGNVGRNKLHNCRFSINQRSYASGTALAAAAYAHDRWKAGTSGCTYTFTQNQPATTITITAGSLQQIVEAMGVDAGVYTLSWTGTAQGRVNAGAYAASPITTASLPANTAITVEFNAGTLSAVQLEVGSVATPLDYGGSPADQLRQCQRYYTVLNRVQWGGYAANSGIALYAPLSLPVSMRAAPTIAFVNPSYANASGVTATQSQPTAVSLYATSSAAGQIWALTDVTASADL